MVAVHSTIGGFCLLPSAFLPGHTTRSSFAWVGRVPRFSLATLSRLPIMPEHSPLFQLSQLSTRIQPLHRLPREAPVK
jgi:hypothetical protein